MRLIDADALSELVGEPIEVFLSRLDLKLPATVDAVPVRHGKWDDMGEFEQCSVCKSTHLKTIETYYGKAQWIKSPYCPQCGAKMDGAERKEK